MNNLKEIYSKININNWIAFREVKKCHYGCKGELKMFVDWNNNKDMAVFNPAYLAHVHQVHGFPPEMLISEVANYIYKNEEDKERMIKFYERIWDNG